MAHLARRSFKTETSSQENARALAESDVSYRLLYWDISSVAATARDILSYGRAKWVNQVAMDEEWDNGKIATPFRVLPLLNIVLPDGKELFLAESIVIDHYLAKKFGLLDHDFHLKANGSNGHFVGNQLSLADIHLANIIDHFSQLPQGPIIIPEFQKCEAIWKVKEAVDSQPDIAAWRASDECKAFVEGSIKHYMSTAVPEESKAVDQNVL
ncbi:hypothetical protein BGZ68_009815 [Mortierella alpina]|nr:hypothetical protein BGZ68_009815 [Mortierella alpina]